MVRPVSGERFTPYQRKLFIFLSVACFFEGYDFMAFGQVRPNLRADMGLSEAMAGNMYAVISLGTMFAYVLVRLADRIGRKRVLTITIAGYTTFTCITALAPEAYTFTAAQFVARIFLIGEWAISMVIAAEEFPASRRGTVIGLIQAFNALGAIACAGIAPLLMKTPLEWRAVYLVSVIPLVLIMYSRRGLKETKRFEEQVKGRSDKQRKLFAIFKSKYRGWVFKLALIWGLVYLSSNVAVAYWKDFAVNEAGLTDGQAGMSIAIAAVLSMPMVFMSGKLIDVIGRRHGAAVIFSVGSVGTFASYTLGGQWLLTGALVFGIFGASAMLAVLNSLTTELFPTEYRADAFAWCNNLLGRVGYVLAPAIVSNIAQETGRLGPVVAATAVFPIIAIFLIYAMIPETKGRELEDTSAVEAV